MYVVCVRYEHASVVLTDVQEAKKKKKGKAAKAQKKKKEKNEVKM